MVEISEVYIRLMSAGDHPRERIARANFTLGGMVSIKGCYVLQFDDGRMILAMPSQRVLGDCPRPHGKTFYRDEDGAPYHYKDVVVLVSTESRRFVETVVLQCYLATVAEGVQEAAFAIEPGDGMRPAAIKRRIYRVPVKPSKFCFSRRQETTSRRA